MKRKGKCSKCGAECEWYWCKKCRKEYNAEHHKRNKERIRKRKSVYQKIKRQDDAYRERKSLVSKAWYQKNKDRVMERNKERAIAKKKLVLDKYGNRCACCGEKEVKFLTLDHKNNNGSEHRKEIGLTTAHLIGWIIRNNFPESIQILCYNCNCSKGHHGECPHETKKQNAKK